MRKRPMLLTAFMAVAVFVLMCGYVRGMVKPPGQDVVVRDVNQTTGEIDQCQEMALRPLVTPGTDDVLVRYSLTHVTLEPGGILDAHRVDAPQVYYFLQGSGIMTVDNRSLALEPGQTVYVPAQVARTLRNTGREELCFLAIDDPDGDSPFAAAGNASIEQTAEQ